MAIESIQQNIRHQNTDWLRALAIFMVLVHHVGQNLEMLPVVVLHYFKLGAHGVDLFFVLSGWLIGGLYWKELQSFGNVEITRFWGRRWLRTLPPYFIALFIAYLSVYIFRQEPFDWSYLFFIQNYREEMPFFLISWSLSVEEHFYLLLPLTIAFFTLLKVPILLALLVLITLALTSRFIDPNAQPGGVFGYVFTASHFHATGLLIGVFLARVKYYHSALWCEFKSTSNWLLIIALITFLSMPHWDSYFRYYYGNSVAVLASACLLMVSQTKKRFWLTGSPIVVNLALCSYSIYLTHSVVLNAGLLMADRLKINYLLASPLLLLSTLIFGWFFYLLVEKTSMTVRDQYVGRRSL